MPKEQSKKKKLERVKKDIPTNPVIESAPPPTVCSPCQDVLTKLAIAHGRGFAAGFDTDKTRLSWSERRRQK